MTNTIAPGLLFRATGFTVGMLLIWIVLNACFDGSIWAGMRISQSALQVEYCEFDHVHQLFRQPINTYSNLAYFFFGVLVLGITAYDANQPDKPNLNRLERFPMLSLLMGVCFIYLSLGSALFHASLTYVGQRVDMNGTYSILITLVGTALYHVFYRINLTLAQKTYWVLALLILIGLFWKVWLVIPSSRLVPALILLLNGLMVLHYVQFPKQRSLWLVILGFGLILMAIRIRTLDVQKVGCDPHSLFQGHALWHVLTALSSFCSYAFFRFTGKGASA